MSQPENENTRDVESEGKTASTTLSATKDTASPAATAVGHATAMGHAGGKFRDFLEYFTEAGLFASRWILAPVYLGLIVSLVVIAIRFFMQLWELVSSCVSVTEDMIVMNILGLLDLALLGNLILIVIFAGYENFVSKINAADNSEDRPSWMGTIDFSGLKIKIIGSLVAISVIGLLQDFLYASSKQTALSTHEEVLRICLHLTFVVSGVLFAVMDYIADKRQTIESGAEAATGGKRD